MVSSRLNHNRNAWMSERITEMADKPELIRFNISGTECLVPFDLLKKYPDCILASKEALSSYWREEINAYYFNRDPALFNIVLNLFRYNRISTPGQYADMLIYLELCYWELPVLQIMAHEELEKDFRWMEGRTPYPEQPASCLQNFRFHVWCILTDPMGPNTRYKRMSLLLSVIMLMVVVLFTISIGISSAEKYREFIVPDSTRNTTAGAEIKWKDVCKTRLECLTITTENTAIKTWLRIGATIFIVETIVRIFTCPSRSLYFRSLMNWLDLLATVCVVIMIVGALTDTIPRLLHILLGGLQVIRLGKIFQVR